MPTLAPASASAAAGGDKTTTNNKGDGKKPADDVDRPKLVVFDMNYTLWPHHIVEDPSPPLQRNENGKIVDANNEEFEPFEGIEDALKKLKSQGHKLAIASTCKEPTTAQRVLDLLEWNDLFDYKAMLPGKPKTKHFNKLNKESSIGFDDMIFFDDKRKNIEDVKKLGVTCVEVGDELNWSEIERGLKMYKKNISD